MSPKTTHVEKRRQQAHESKLSITEILGWKEEVYCEHQYNIGLAYLNYYIPTDPIGMEFLVRSKIFWNWWKNKWADRDQDFLDQWLPRENWKKVQRRTLVLLYLELNDPMVLSEDIKPHAVVLGDSYAKMYQDVIDNEILPLANTVK